MLYLCDIKVHFGESNNQGKFTMELAGLSFSKEQSNQLGGQMGTPFIYATGRLYSHTGYGSLHEIVMVVYSPDGSLPASLDALNHPTISSTY